MIKLNFMTSTGEELTLQYSSDEKMKEIFKKYAERIGKNHRQLIFFYNGSKIDKKLTVKELLKNQSKIDDFILVKIMDSNVEKDSDDEKSKVLKSEILEEFKNPNKNLSYEEIQELVVQYGYETEKKIEEEMKKNPENFIDIEDAIKQKDSNEGLFVLGKLGESLKDMGIKVAIDKRDIKSDNYIINNQFISSGIIKKNKYEIHIEEKDSKKKYEILNNENAQNKFKEEWKEKISNFVKVPKDDIFITNIRNGSITMDVIFKRTEIKDKLGFKINIDEGMKKFANTNEKVISVYSKNILGCCKLTLDMLDPRGNQSPDGWAAPGSKRGGLEYYPPDSNWIGYGLRVLNQYDNGNNDWIEMNGNENEWAVAYHGTSESAVKPICSKEGKFFSTKAEGATGQKCEDDININPLSQKQFPICGEGTYCSPHLDYANKYANMCKSGIIIMCRVNPNIMRIPQSYAENEWITDGTKGSIRPYRLLYNLKN